MKKFLMAGMVFAFLGIPQQSRGAMPYYLNWQDAAKDDAINAIPGLLKRGLLINNQDDDGNTALHIAAIEGHGIFIQKLIEESKKAAKTINVNLKNNVGQTPLHYASLNVDSPATVDFLVDNGANINEQDDSANTPLHLAAMHGKINVVQKLVERKANLEARANDKKTPLHYAAKGQDIWNLKIVKELISHRANVKAEDEHGTTPLHVAAYFGSLKIVQELIKHKADVNAVDRDWGSIATGTPLHYAVLGGSLSVVRELVENGADVTKTNAKGLTPLDIAVKVHPYGGNEDIIKFLISKTPGMKSIEKYFQKIEVLPKDWIKVGWLYVPEYKDSVLIHIYDKEADPHINELGMCNFEYVMYTSPEMGGYAENFGPILIDVDDSFKQRISVTVHNLYYWKSDYEKDQKKEVTDPPYTFILPEDCTLSNKPENGPRVIEFRTDFPATPSIIKNKFEAVEITWNWEEKEPHPSASLWKIKKSSTIQDVKDFPQTLEISIPKSELEKKLILLNEKLAALSKALNNLKQKLIDLKNKLSGKSVTTPVVKEVYITLVHGDIVNQKFENDAQAAIVNAAKTTMRGDGGIDRAIHTAAGPGLLQEEIKRNLSCPVGEARLTGGHNLAPLRIIHTVGPMGSDSDREEKLRSAYLSCLKLADQNNITAIAFCGISTEIFKYNTGQATPLALATVFDYLTKIDSKTKLSTKIREIRFIVFSELDYNLYSAILLNNENDMKTLQGTLKQFTGGSYKIDINFPEVTQLHKNYILTKDSSAISGLKLKESSFIGGKTELCFKLKKK